NRESQRLAVGQMKKCIKKSTLLIPQANLAAGRTDCGRGDRHEVLHEFASHVGVEILVQRQLDTDFEHVEAEERHPCSAVRLLQAAAGRQGRAAIEYADRVQAE